MPAKRIKKHRPFDAMARFQAKIPIADNQRRDVALVVLAALNALSTGRGSEQCWAHVASAMNVGVMMCEIGICADSLAIFKAAQDGLIRARERGLKAGKWGFDGDAYSAAIEAVTVHQVQYAIATRAQVQQAIHTVYDRVKSGEYM